MLIRDVLKRDLDEKIQEVIKVSQADGATVYNELTQYVATQSIRRHYRTLLKAIAEGQTEPTENNEVWISGFFGSGKSSFAKNLGYALSNPTVMGYSAAELFKNALDDPQISALIDSINARIKTEVIMFDVSADRNMRQSSEQIAEIMYRVLLSDLGYASDYTIAELEIELEHAGVLEDFITRFENRFKQPWRKLRTSAQGINRASAILHEIEPSTYPSADSWANVAEQRAPIITVNKFVDRVFELMALRRPGKALTFIIDEVGQYVAYSSDKLENLRVVVEALGRESKNRVKRRLAVAPFWTIVTSQERLDEVISAIEDRRVQIAKVQDRFYHKVDLAPSDIREVATKRVLAKRDEAKPELRRIFQASQGQLNTATRFEQSNRRTELREDDFLLFYPYLPHFIDLSIDIVSGIRLQPGADRHLGGSNRTIIKQSHEMLVSEQTRMAERNVGALVTLDLVYDLVDVNLTSERRKDIADVVQRFQNLPEDKGWAARVAKSLCLLEFIKDLPRTPSNIAAVLVDEVGKSAPLREVETGLERLEHAQFVRRTSEGYKLQTAQEKNWTTERSGLPHPKRSEHNEILREVLKQIFGEPSLKVYRFNDRTLQVGVTIDDFRLTTENQVPLILLLEREESKFASRVEEARMLSRNPAHSNEIYWVFALNEEAHTLISQLHASRQMVAKYSHISNQEQISGDYSSLLANERREEVRLKGQLHNKLEAALCAGQGMFQGVAKDVSDLGQNVSEIFRHLFDFAVPTLYPYLPMGTRRLKGTETEEVLKAVNLVGLAPVFYDGKQGLELVVRDGNRNVVNRQAPIAQEILGYLKKKHDYGETVTGRELSTHFGGLGYGWEDDILRLVLAVLLRAGAIEVTHQARRYRDYQSIQVRAPLTNPVAYRSASFAPRELIDTKTLVNAAQNYEALIGKNIEAEEPAIALALRNFADEEVQQLLPVRAQAQAYRLPIVDFLNEYLQRLKSIQGAESDDCVHILSGEGKSLKTEFDHARRIREALTDANLTMLQQARKALQEQWPLIEKRAESQEIAEKVGELQSLLELATFYEHFAHIRNLLEKITNVYSAIYDREHRARYVVYAQAINDLKERAEWQKISDTSRASILMPLTERICENANLPTSATVCNLCKSTINEMITDRDALTYRVSQALALLRESIAPALRYAESPSSTTMVRESFGGLSRTATVRIAEFFDDVIDDEAAIEAALDRLRIHLRKLVAEGMRIHIE